MGEIGLKAIILAAGYATRLYPLTMNTPKSLLPLGQETIIDHIIRKIEHTNANMITDIIIISNAKFAPAFRQWAASRTFSRPVHIVDDGSTSEVNRLGAVGDIHYAIQHLGLDEDVLILAGDNIFTFDIQDYIAYFHQVKSDCILVQHIDRLEDLQRVGVAELDKASKVISFEEKPTQPRTDIGVYAIYLFQKETLPLFTTYLIEGNNADAPGYFPEWLYKRKDLYAYFARGKSFDIGTHSAYLEVKEQWEQNNIE
ncbi:nucleotidyltransferase family protein [Paenibacillus pini]|uniref:Glucose-1-phosphate thymidylyltransferase n=1 Tax=Paenibacillus pini JCM 16418 TaxID=1236976 RepID=W7YGI5_9BACL|nr:nucleotidyltransferase family protein [Paenibacillus pini]GAF06668.1 glucose-1-phosphate thymidylyltransferase [Paenibacillus pini JCM 16418]